MLETDVPETINECVESVHKAGAIVSRFIRAGRELTLLGHHCCLCCVRQPRQCRRHHGEGEFAATRKADLRA